MYTIIWQNSEDDNNLEEVREEVGSYDEAAYAALNGLVARHDIAKVYDNALDKEVLYMESH